ncbi:unnamed protein product [Diatraea saccharalis]|uniref:Uncharacterized protein n=1 Tax=Diatraea saccharalis TaxID=40085 RepID=A0A9N9QWL1_9NEOP|nr:unnamed protein product [Diatraea saccharalis]
MCSCYDRFDKYQQLQPDISEIDELFHEKLIKHRDNELIGKLIQAKTLYNDIRDEILYGSNIDKNTRLMIGHRQLPAGDNKYENTIHTTGNFMPKGKRLQRSRIINKDYCSCCKCINCNQKRYHSKTLNGDLNSTKRFKNKYIKSESCPCTMRPFDFGKHVKETNDKTTERSMSTFSTIQSRPIEVKRVICECKPENLFLDKIKLAEDTIRDSVRNSFTKLRHSFRETKRNSSDIIKDKNKKINCECYVKTNKKKSNRKLQDSSKGNFRDNAKNRITKSQYSFKVIRDSTDLVKDRNKKIKKCECECKNEKKSHGKLSELAKDNFRDNKRNSLKKLQYPFKEPRDSADLYKDKTEKINKIKCECYGKLNDTKSNRKLREYTSRVSMKAYSKMKTANTKFRHSIRNSITKIASTFQMARDSIELYKYRRLIKQLMKELECESDTCDPDECNPSECYEKIKFSKKVHNFASDSNRKIKKRFHKEPKPNSDSCECSNPSMINLREYDISSSSTIKPEVSKADRKKNGFFMLIEPANTEKIESKNTISPPMKTSTISTTDFDTSHPCPKECQSSICIPEKCYQDKSSLISMPHSKSDTGFILNNNVIKSTKKKSQIIDDINTQKVVRFGSSFSFNLEFYKTVSSERLPKEHVKLASEITPTKRSVSHALRRCFCTLKFKNNNQNYGSDSYSIKNKTAHPNNLKTKKRKKTCECEDKKRVSKSYPTFKQKSENTESDAWFPSNVNTFDDKSVQTITDDECICFMSVKSIQTVKTASLDTKILPNPFCTPYGDSIDCNSYVNPQTPCNCTRNNEYSSRNTISSYIRKPMSEASSSRRELIQRNIIKPQIRESSYYNDNITTQQVLSIGSTFSFNIDFYKNAPSNNQKHSAITNLHTERPSEYKSITGLQKPYKEPVMKKCFCTLKLLKRNKAVHLKPKRIFNKSAAFVKDIKRNKKSSITTTNPRSYGTSKSYQKSQMLASISEPTPDRRNTTNKELKKIADNNNVGRLGSSISFNMKFYKRIKQPNLVINDKFLKEKYKKQKFHKNLRPVSLKECAVQCTGLQKRASKKTRAIINTHEKGVVTSSPRRRCFCVRKFLKRNKLGNSKESQFGDSFLVAPKTDKQTRTKHYKKFKKRPNICCCGNNVENLHYCKDPGTEQAHKYTSSNINSNKKQVTFKSQNFDYVTKPSNQNSARMKIICIPPNWKLPNKNKKHANDDMIEINNTYKEYIDEHPELVSVKKQCLCSKFDNGYKDINIQDGNIPVSNFPVKPVLRTLETEANERKKIHRRQFRAKSVENIGDFSLKAKRMLYSWSDNKPYSYELSKQLSTVKNTKQKNRLQKRTKVGSQLSFGIDFYKRIEYPNADFERIIYNQSPGKINKNRIRNSKFSPHRQYQVGYMLSTYKHLKFNHNYK